MLPYGLAIAVGLSSLILFLTAFFMPKIHRQDDFIWSGLGLFYALVLWFCASQLTTALLFGQVAVVILLLSYTWQVIKLRKAIVSPSPSPQSKLSGFSVSGLIGDLFNRNPKVVDSQPEKKENVEKIQESEELEEVPVIEKVDRVEEVAKIAVEEVQDKVDEVIEKVEEVQEVVSEADLSLENETEKVVEVTTEKKSGLFNKFLNVGNKEQTATSESKPSLTNTKLDALLDGDLEEESQSEEIVAAPREADLEEIAESIVESNAEEKPESEITSTMETIAEEEKEEETNWDFLDDEQETDSTEEISSSEQETNSEN